VDKALLVIGSIAIAAMVSMILGRHRIAGPTPNAHHIPDQLSLGDFPEADGNWLVVVFSSAKCETCSGVVDTITKLARPEVSTREITVERHADLHSRYRIDGVPTTVIADPTGLVHRSFLGPVNQQALSRALDDAMREPDSGDL